MISLIFGVIAPLMLVENMCRSFSEFRFVQVFVVPFVTDWFGY